jgi:hypothetical protein
MASGPSFGRNFASGAASGQNLAFGRNELFKLITAFGHVKLIGHVGHTNGLVNHNSQIQPQLIVVIAKDYKIYLFFQEDCRIYCEGVKDRCNGLIRDGGVGYTGIDGSLIKLVVATVDDKLSKGSTKINKASSFRHMASSTLQLVVASINDKFSKGSTKQCLTFCWQTKQIYQQQIPIQHLSISCHVNSNIKS